MFDPSEKQLAALANMEDYFSVGSNRTQFKDHDEFQEYWNLVSKRCDKVSRHKNTDGPSTTPGATAEQNKKRNNAKTAHYNEPEKLRSYAKKYCQRYQPSVNKLRMQLVRKSHNQELSDEVIKDLAQVMVVSVEKPE